MTTTLTPEQQLSSAFDEIDLTKNEVAKTTKKEQEAQKKAGDTNGLTAAAQTDMRNAEATYRVLAAAVEETKSLRDRRAQIKRDLHEIGQVERIYKIAKAAGVSLQNAVNDVDPIEDVTRRARDTTLAAQHRAQEVADALRGTPASAAGGTPASQSGKPAPRARSRAAKPGSELQNRLDTIVQDLDGEHERLLELHREAVQSQRGLQDQLAAVQAVEGEAATFANELLPQKTELEKELADIDRTLAAEPSDDEVRRNKAALDAAQRRFQDAPATERQAQEQLKVAREAREDAERRYSEALDRRDRAERLFIRGIDITGPTAAGIFTASADLAEQLPPGFRLQWSSNAGTVTPAKGNTVKFDTGHLPPGSYDIEVSVVRTRRTT
jgi:hypothetical protein